jgi:hypothetical protein
MEEISQRRGRGRGRSYYASDPNGEKDMSDSEFDRFNNWKRNREEETGSRRKQKTFGSFDMNADDLHQIKQGPRDNPRRHIERMMREQKSRDEQNMREEAQRQLAMAQRTPLPDDSDEEAVRYGRRHAARTIQHKYRANRENEQMNIRSLSKAYKEGQKTCPGVRDLSVCEAQIMETPMDVMYPCHLKGEGKMGTRGFDRNRRCEVKPRQQFVREYTDAMQGKEFDASELYKERLGNLAKIVGDIENHGEYGGAEREREGYSLWEIRDAVNQSDDNIPKKLKNKLFPQWKRHDIDEEKAQRRRRAKMDQRATKKKPSLTTKKPTVVQKKPSLTKKKPTVAKKKPVATKKKPAATAKKSTVTKKKPTKKPVATKKKPVATKKKPVVTKKKPVATKKKPVVTTKKPVATKKKCH